VIGRARETPSRSVFRFQSQSSFFGKIGIVDLLAQHSRALESDHPARVQNDGIPRLRIPAAALIFLLNLKLSETAYQNVFAVFKALLYDLEKGFNDLGRFGFGEIVTDKEILNDVGFRQRHIKILLTAVSGAWMKGVSRYVS
jgi:hypothetical protein